MSIDAIESGNVVAETSWSGFTKIDVVRASVTLEPGVEPTPEFFDYLVALAWSVNDQQPNRPLSIYIRSDPQVNVQEIAEDAGWSWPGKYGFDEEGGYVAFGGAEERFGPWPGKPPEVPTDALTLPVADK